MAKKILVINPGSASKKYALYSDERELLSANFETENGAIVVNIKEEGKTEKRGVSESDLAESLQYIFNLITERGLIADKDDVQMIGIRVVAPGNFFLEHRLIDSQYLQKLEEVVFAAPLHVRPTLDEIKIALSLFKDIPLAGISDSAFHKEMPSYAKNYAIVNQDASRLGVYRFGYHGLSVQSITRKLRNNQESMPPKIIVCHLGGGSSITALKNGTSVENSMGFSPLEGLPMNTRVGNIDASAVIYIAKKTNRTLDELENYLNRECGFLGLSGKSGDVRELIGLEINGDTEATLALDNFAYTVKKYIGAYFAVLDGLDVLVFSGAIGERSAVMRSRICRNLKTLGILLDEEKNNSTIEKEGFVQTPGSAVKIAIILTDEMAEIARECVNAK